MQDTAWIIRPHGANPAGGSFYSLSCPSRGSLYTPSSSPLLVFITIVIFFLWLSISHLTASSRLLFLSTPWSLWFASSVFPSFEIPFPSLGFFYVPLGYLSSWFPLKVVQFYWPLIWLFCLSCFFQRFSFNRRKKKCILFQESEGNIFNLGSVGSTDAKTPDSKNESDVEKSIQDGVVGDHHHHHHRHNNAKDSLPPGLSSCSLPLAPFHPFYRSPVWTKIKCQLSPSMIIMIITV